MNRELYKSLLQWKNNPNKKPLLIQGARQVGKTYLVKQFGKKEYANFINLNFEKNPDLKNLFTSNLNPQTIINNLSLYLGKKITSENTLIFFDEIQISEKALTSLKYFCEEAPEYHIIGAGSLLGVTIGKETSFPVGKVNFLKMYPMSFKEYLTAIGEELLLEEMANIKNSLLEPLHNKLLTHFKMYLYIGGMPEPLQNYLLNKDIEAVRKIQKEILTAYSNDFSKYTEKTQVIKTSELWNSIPFQLAKENKKFKYSDVRKKARASTFEQTIEWLKRAGLINIAYNLTSPKLPLSGYADYSKFKIYVLDTGLLGAMLNLSSEIITKPTELFTHYNGAFIENYVASELIISGNEELYYWTSKSDAEVDFVLQIKNNIIPLEVKSGTSRNLKSLRSYSDKYKPKFVCRISPRNFIEQNDFINIPLYAAFNINKILNQKL